MQYQQNEKDCGILAIAFATSLVLKKNPSTIIYDYGKLRNHLSDMFLHYELIDFPSCEVRSNMNHTYLKNNFPHSKCRNPCPDASEYQISSEIVGQIN